MRFNILDMAGGRTVLSAGVPGRQLFAALVASTVANPEPSLAFLDFAGIEVATTSFLRESVIAYRDYARSSLPNVYPVAANLAPAVAEELEFFLRARNDVYWACNVSDDNSVTAARLLGELDPAQRATFDAVVAAGSTTAPDLAARFPDLNIGHTAWNNRLSNLAAKGLVVEQRSGKAKSFSPLLEIA